MVLLITVSVSQLHITAKILIHHLPRTNSIHGNDPLSSPALPTESFINTREAICIKQMVYVRSSSTCANAANGSSCIHLIQQSGQTLSTDDE
jgi:hypothetical protein